MTVEPGRVHLKRRCDVFDSYDGRGSSHDEHPSEAGTATVSFSYVFKVDDTGKGCWTGTILGNAVAVTIKK